MTSAYSDTFPRSQGCHCKRGSLYHQSTPSPTLSFICKPPQILRIDIDWSALAFHCSPPTTATKRRRLPLVIVFAALLCSALRRLGLRRRRRRPMVEIPSLQLWPIGSSVFLAGNRSFGQKSGEISNRGPNIHQSRGASNSHHGRGRRTTNLKSRIKCTIFVTVVPTFSIWRSPLAAERASLGSLAVRTYDS